VRNRKAAVALVCGDSASGIARNGLLNESRYFYVADSEKQVMDAFHDFLEGTVSFVVCQKQNLK
jgi:hypothetical protein